MLDLMIERISLRLDFWKTALLSKGARLTLLKMTLGSIHNYYLSLFTIPTSLIGRIESSFCKFLWNDVEDHHRDHLVDRKSVCAPMDCGLGVRSIMSHNRVLLVKWLWRFGFGRDSLWRKVVARFGEKSRWESNEVQLRHGCGL